MKTVGTFIGIAAAVALSSAAWGAITYVDATRNTTGSDGNTTINGALVTGTNTGTSVTDGLWRYRAFTGSAGGSLWETDTSSTAGETTEPLITSIPLPAGTYNVYGFFRDQAGGSSYWDGAFSLDGSTYSTFDYRNAPVALGDGSEFTNPGDLGDIILASGDIYIASLGQIVLANAATVPFYVQGPEQDLSGTPQMYSNNTGQRTWYEGVGYELVPEPESIMLTVIGIMGVAVIPGRRLAARTLSTGPNNDRSLTTAGRTIHHFSIRRILS